MTITKNISINTINISKCKNKVNKSSANSVLKCRIKVIMIWFKIKSIQIVKFAIKCLKKRGNLDLEVDKMILKILQFNSKILVDRLEVRQKNY